MARLVAVLAFVRAYEPIPPSEVLEFANLLVALFKISQEELLGERTLQERLDLVISVTQFGRVQLQPESDVSIGLRRMAKPLHVTPSMSIDSSANIWVLTRDQDLNDQ